MLEAVVQDEVVQQNAATQLVPWWSFTKTVLAAAALRLVARGDLTLDEPHRGRPYTLRQLLQHRAGLPDYGGEAAYHRAVAAGERPWSVEELRERIQAGRLRYAPGTDWRYSNVGYLEVRQAIEHTTGLPLDTALQQLVLAPLELSEAEVRLARVPADLTETAWGNATHYHLGRLESQRLAGDGD